MLKRASLAEEGKRVHKIAGTVDLMEQLHRTAFRLDQDGRLKQLAL